MALAPHSPEGGYDVSQIPTPPLKAAPTAKAAIAMIQIWPVIPNTASGRHPKAHSKFVAVK